MPSDHDPAPVNAALAPRFHQMFPVLSPAEIDRVRRFGEVRRFSAGELLFQAGEAPAGMYVILSGRVSILPRDGLGQLSGRPGLSVLDARAVGDVEAIVVPPGELRRLLVAEAELASASCARSSCVASP